MKKDMAVFENEDQRRRAVAWTVALLAAFPIDAHRLARLTRSELEALAKTNLYHVLYRSTATRRFTSSELFELLEKARHFNVKSQITGMLLYSEGHFVQVIEGPEKVIRTLHSRILQDSRHHHVETVDEGPLLARQFAEWSMDFGFAPLPAAGQEPGTPTPALPGLSTTSSHLKRLLEVFIG